MERRRWWRDGDGVAFMEVVTYADDGRPLTVLNPAGDPVADVEDPSLWPLRHDVSVIDADAFYAETADAKRQARDAVRSGIEARVAELIDAGLPEAAARRLVPQVAEER